MLVPSFFLTALSFVSPYLPTVFVDQSRGTLVKLRIEGQNTTLFEDHVWTWPHDVDPQCGGKHRCDGTNLNRSTTPGPTVTGTLDNAASAHGFTWNGCFDKKYDDYYIETIHNESNTTTQYWTSVLNYRATDYGGCQVKVNYMDEVMWAKVDLACYPNHFLKLSGPIFARVNRLVLLKVVDGATGKPVAGADVDGKKSDKDGHVRLIFTTPGHKNLKAEKPNSCSVRSNKLMIRVGQ